MFNFPNTQFTGQFGGGSSPYQNMGQGLGNVGQVAADRLSTLFPGGFQNWLSAKMGGTGGWNTQVNPAGNLPPQAAPYAQQIWQKLQGSLPQNMPTGLPGMNWLNPNNGG